MERESFEDEEVAGYLNQHFVAIKVDREERPDVDHIYMSVCQAMTGQGGWPLTIVMTPDKKPFFAGTYFPKRRQYGRLGLVELLQRLDQVWTEDRAKAEEAGDEIARQLQGGLVADRVSSELADKNEPSLTLCERASEYYRKQFDSVYGGFGGAPKFPSPHNLSFLIRQAQLTGEDSLAQMALHTLTSMYRGGLWDHVGFGFARYSTDEKWLVPHFEKMLYDNALLAEAFLDAYVYSQDPFFARVADEIFVYIKREMTSAEGAFYSAQDADSEGEEGKFYLFSPGELAEILGTHDATWFGSLFGVSASGNFEGRTILNLLGGREGTSWPLEDVQNPQYKPDFIRLKACRDKLYLARARRVPPYKDDKILTSWNALMIAALAKAARVLDNDDYREAAERALTFIDQTLTREDGRLLARYRDGEAKYLGYLEDYAYLAYALLNLYDTTLAPKYLSRVLEMTRIVQRLFADERKGGYFYYGSDAEELLARPKEYDDGAMPSGNSVWAHVLSRLAVLTDDESITSWRDRQIANCYAIASRYPTGFSHFLMALQVALSPPITVVLAAANRVDEGLDELIRTARTYGGPHVAVLLRTDEWVSQLAEIAPFTSSQVPPADGGVNAYVCVGFACRRPVSTVKALIETLSQAHGTRGHSLI